MNDQTRARLIDEARQAATASHSPYSRFRVGAAVLTRNGSIVRGCNIESASYGLPNCAERVALGAAIARDCGTPVAIAVSCPDGDLTKVATVMPCGACRQVMSELLVEEAEVIVDGVGVFTVDELLPRAFRL